MLTRPARIDDVPALVALIDGAAAALTERLGAGYWSKRVSPRRMRERILDSDPTLLEKGWFVGVDGARVVAVIALATRPFLAWREQLWARPDQPGLGVFDLAVDPALQGRGLGRAMMRFAERTARARKLPWVRLDAYAANPASNEFYRRIRYVERGAVTAGGVALVLYERAVSVRARARAPARAAAASSRPRRSRGARRSS